MSRAHVAVLQVASKQLSVTEAAVEYGYSRRHLHRLLARYRQGGLDALEPRSRRPLSNPAATSLAVRERVIELRSQLIARGLDAGPQTIAWHLERQGLKPPAPATISRILHDAGLIRRADVARRIIKWTRAAGWRATWGRGKVDGSFLPVLEPAEHLHYPIALYSYGRVEIQFQWLTRPPVDRQDTKLALLEQLNQIPGVSWPSVPDHCGRPGRS